MTTVICNRLFTLEELNQVSHGTDVSSDNTYLFTLKSVVDYVEPEVKLLVEGLSAICGRTDTRSSIVLNTLDMPSVHFFRKFLMLNMEAFKQMNQSGMRRLVVVTTSPVISVSTNIFKKICGTSDMVFTAPTLVEGLKLAEENKI